MFYNTQNNVRILVPIDYPYQTFGLREVTKVLPKFTNKRQCSTLLMNQRMKSQYLLFIIILFF